MLGNTGIDLEKDFSGAGIDVLPRADGPHRRGGFAVSGDLGRARLARRAAPPRWLLQDVMDFTRIIHPAGAQNGRSRQNSPPLRDRSTGATCAERFPATEQSHP